MKKLTLTLILAFIVIGGMAQTKDTLKFKFIDSSVTASSTALPSFAISPYSFPKCYRVNWSKVKTFKDLKLLMQVMNIQYCLDEKQLTKIKKYLIEYK